MTQTLTPPALTDLFKSGSIRASADAKANPTPLEAAAFMSAVNYLQAALAPGENLPDLLRARANELNELADLVQAAQDMTHAEPDADEKGGPSDKDADDTSDKDAAAKKE